MPLTGMPFLRMFISSDGFLSSGVTAADFIESGMRPDCREELMKSVMRAMLCRSSFSNHIGTRSRAHALVEDFMTIRETSLIVSGTKTQSSGWQGDNRGLYHWKPVPDFLNLILEEVCKLIG